ncbi:MAG: substrate-binding domain-containing protein [Verrucomicrobia bacterium]|nr:substrate-binding domain-containing protein [Verrucomicrobiota bacterium]
MFQTNTIPAQAANGIVTRIFGEDGRFLLWTRRAKAGESESMPGANRSSQVPTPFGPRRAKPPWRVAVLCGSRSPIWAAEQIAQAAVESLAQAGCLVRVVTMRKAEPQGKAFLRELRQRGFDGAIDLHTGWISQDGLPVQAWQFPMVCLNRLPARIEADVVMVDEAAVARQMLDHLWAIGHRRCGYLIALDMLHAQRRFEAFRKEAQAKGMWDETLVLDLRARTTGDPWSSLELDQFHELPDFFAQRPKPLAMWSHNDFVAAALAEWLLEQGYRLPAEVAVAGVDNHPLYALANVPLTTVSIPFADLGRQSVRRLLDRLRGFGASTVRPIFLPPTLVVRQSTVPRGTPGDWLNVVLTTVAERFTQRNLTGEILKKLGWRQDALAHRFHRAMGCTLLQYRDRLRLEHAAKLLLNEPSSKTQIIACAIGFSSPSRFAAAFRRKFGVNPAEYRARTGADRTDYRAASLVQVHEWMRG